LNNEEEKKMRKNFKKSIKKKKNWGNLIRQYMQAQTHSSHLQ